MKYAVACDKQGDQQSQLRDLQVELLTQRGKCRSNIKPVQRECYKTNGKDGQHPPTHGGCSLGDHAHVILTFLRESLDNTIQKYSHAREPASLFFPFHSDILSSG